MPMQIRMCWMHLRYIYGSCADGDAPNNHTPPDFPQCVGRGDCSHSCGCRCGPVRPAESHRACLVARAAHVAAWRRLRAPLYIVTPLRAAAGLTCEVCDIDRKCKGVGEGPADAASSLAAHLLNRRSTEMSEDERRYERGRAEISRDQSIRSGTTAAAAATATACASSTTASCKSKWG